MSFVVMPDRNLYEAERAMIKFGLPDRHDTSWIPSLAVDQVEGKEYLVAPFMDGSEIHIDLDGAGWSINLDKVQTRH